MRSHPCAGRWADCGGRDTAGIEKTGWDICTNVGNAGEPLQIVAN